MTGETQKRVDEVDRVVEERFRKARLVVLVVVLALGLAGNLAFQWLALDRYTESHVEHRSRNETVHHEVFCVVSVAFESAGFDVSAEIGTFLRAAGEYDATEALCPEAVD